MKLDFKKIARPSDPKYSFFGGSNLGNGVSLGILGASFRSMSSAAGKKMMKAKFGRPTLLASGDGKVTWEYYFTHWSTPSIIYTVYDWKGGLSCGLGVPDSVFGTLDPRFVRKVNELLTELTDYCFKA